MSTSHTKRSRKGFSLLELSVALVVVSLVVGFGVTGGKNAVEGSERVTTEQRMKTIKKALDSYARQNGYLPCPSRRDQQTSSSTYGIESRSGGACTVAGDIKSVPSTAPTTYIGAVPVRSLGLPDAYGADSWGNKFLYSVGINLTVGPYALMTSDGTIGVKYGNRFATSSGGTNYYITTDRSGAPGPAASYIVVSHGPDGKGAYPLSGSAVAVACGTGNSNDVENCDEKDATFYDTAYNEGTSANTFFDDYVVWSSNALERAPLIEQEGASIVGTCLTGWPNSGTACESEITNANETPDCDKQCADLGYSSGGVSVTNCTYNAAACTAGDHMRCNFKCCCNGVPPAGCQPTTASWSVAGGNSCFGDIAAPIPHNGTVTVPNAKPGFSGQVTAACASGTISYSSGTCTALTYTSSTTSTSSGATTLSSSTTSSSTGGFAGCSTGNCSEWCAPCSRFNGGRVFRGNVCEKVLISTSPCRAYCVYAGCGWSIRGGRFCSQCP